jgi:hypothetical protein
MPLEIYYVSEHEELNTRQPFAYLSYCSVRSEQAKTLATVEMQRDVVDGNLVPEHLTKVPDNNRVFVLVGIGKRRDLSVLLSDIGVNVRVDCGILFVD